jgi:hypothetical protein
MLLVISQLSLALSIKQVVAIAASMIKIEAFDESPTLQ